MANFPCECHGKSKSLNKLQNARDFTAAEKWMVRSPGVGGFISLQNGNLRRLKLLRVFRRCYIDKICFEKRGTNKKVSLVNKSSLISPRTQHKVVLLVMLTVFAVGF